AVGPVIKEHDRLREIFGQCTAVDFPDHDTRLKRTFMNVSGYDIDAKLK
ncbi:8573_t:CDS:1, partial [Gigaspora rosea]